jgi:hypothetical protein
MAGDRARHGVVALAEDAYVWGLYPVVTYETRFSSPSTTRWR